MFQGLLQKLQRFGWVAVHRLIGLDDQMKLKLCPEFGTIVLGFVRSPAAPGGLLLEGWTAIDAQNKRTTVKLDSQRYNVAVGEGAFAYAEPKKRAR